MQDATLSNPNDDPVITRLDRVITLLEQNCNSTGEQSYGNVKRSGNTDAYGGAPGGLSPYEVFMKEQESKKGPRKVKKESTPVDITGMAPKTLDNLADAVSRGTAKLLPDGKSLQDGSWIDNILGTIGVPLLALAGGITALFSAANIDWDGLEGTMDAIGKYGLMGGLKVFLAPFAKLAGKSFLTKIPVIGGIVSFYFAYEDYKNKEWTGMTLNLISGFLNLVGTFIAPGIANGLAIGVDILNAYLDTQTQGMSGEQKAEAKKDILINMGEAIWEKIQDYVRYIPVVGSVWLFQDMVKAWDNQDYANAVIFGVRALVNLVPLKGTILNLGLGVMQGFLSEDQRKSDKVSATAVDFLTQFSEPFEKYVSGWIREVPFIGSFFYIGDFIKNWQDGKYGQAIADFGMAILGLIPGWNMLNPVIGFFRGMFDEEYAQRTASGSLGASTWDWIGEIAAEMKNWVAGMLYSLVDMLPDWLGWGVEEFLSMTGMERPSGEKRKKPKYHVNEQGVKRKQLTQEQIEELNTETLEALREKGDISKEEKEMIDEELDYVFFRADGGPVPKGQPTIVGERGPEAIVPDEDSYVINNNDLRDAVAAAGNEFTVDNKINTANNEVFEKIAKSGEDTITALINQTEVLTQLHVDIIEAIEKTGTVVNNTSISSTSTGDSGNSVRSFRENVRDRWFT